MTIGAANLRFAVPLGDGSVVEAVHYPGGTLCISTQVGCALRCPFCASGRGGLFRSLSAAELEGQVAEARSRGLQPRRITLSGIGEPLHNPVAVRLFMERYGEETLSVSLTTTGSPLERLLEFLPGPDNGLMLSLHAASPPVHRRLLPRGPDLAELWQLLDQRLPGLSRRRRRKLGINYLLLEGVNDAAGEIATLIRRLRRHSDLTLHLLTCNSVPGGSFGSPPPEQVTALWRELRAAGLRVRRANPWRGLEGGCGTLLARPAGVAPPAGYDRLSQKHPPIPSRPS